MTVKPPSILPPRLGLMLLTAFAITAWRFLTEDYLWFPYLDGEKTPIGAVILFLLNAGFALWVITGVLLAVALYLQTLFFIGNRLPLFSKSSMLLKSLALSLFALPVLFWLAFLKLYTPEISSLMKFDYIYVLSVTSEYLEYIQQLCRGMVLAFIVGWGVELQLGRIQPLRAWPWIPIFLIAAPSFPMAIGVFFLGLHLSADFTENFIMRKTSASSRLLLIKLVDVLDEDGDGRIAMFSTDCKPDDPKIYLGQREMPQNGIDDNCLLGDFKGFPIPEKAKTLQLVQKSVWERMEAKPNLIIIIIDALRADRLGKQGYEKNLTPNIDKFLDTAHYFEDTLTQGGATSQSLGCVFSGRYRPPKAKAPLLDPFVDAGWHGRAFISSPVLSSVLDAEKILVDASVCPGMNPHECNYIESSDGVLKRAKQWLEKAPEPFLLLLHFNDPHLAYLPHDDIFFSRDHGDLYDAEIAHTDIRIGALLKSISNLGLDERTILTLISDHGECQNDCRKNGGGFLHGEGVSPAEMKVVMAIRHPKSLPNVIKTPVELIDLMPTLLDLTGLATQWKTNGRSLVKLMRKMPDAYPYKGRFTRAKRGYQEWLGYYDAGHFLEFNLLNGSVKMYKAQDKRLLNDLSETKVEEYTAMKTRFFQLIEALGY